MKHIYVCSPSSPFRYSKEEVGDCVKKLESLGFTITFSQHAFDNIGNTSSTLENRVKDIMEGFLNPSYDIVAATEGGWNSNELLPYLDFKLLQQYKKPLVGMSDITTLCVNLWQKSEVPTFYGMNFWYFVKANDIESLREYTNTVTTKIFNGFYNNQITQEKILRSGQMSGRLVGGNLALLCWLAGTSFELQVPDNAILFLEDDDETNGYYWQMYLTHLKQLGYFEKVSGVIFGKVLPQTKFTEGSDFISIIKHVLGEYSFPILIDADFGHIPLPRTIPYGIEYSLEV